MATKTQNNIKHGPFEIRTSFKSVKFEKLAQCKNKLTTNQNRKIPKHLNNVKEYPSRMQIKFK